MPLIRIGDVTMNLEAAGPDRRPAVVLAHGAGGRMDDRGMLALASLYRSRGLHVVRFNFPYTEKGSRRPDPMPVLKSCIASVAERIRAESSVTELILGGRSMGGRAASMLVADGFVCDGLLLLAYPLHPAGKPDQLRDAHLPSITVPTLCLNGTRDTLCRRDLMDAVVQRLSSNWRMHWLEEADHGFHVRKSSGRTDDDVLREIGDQTERWLHDGRFTGRH
ncbi:MAG TPA: alpha/beta family hydrolase [Casimicrobiaceae bacterium]|nr:alpha/beta family hydrolase [Casimicrobiaceae bacterium]